MDGLKKEDLAKKHSALVGLLNKLAVNHYELEPLELDHSKPFDPAKVKNIKLDRSWYFMQVKIMIYFEFIHFLYFVIIFFFFFSLQ